MLFNSYVFLLAFLPVTLIASFWLARRGAGPAVATWLLIASLFFYAHWNPPFLFLLLGSIGFNYALAWCLFQGDSVPPKRRRVLLALGIVANLLVLAQCKYLRFLTEAVNQVSGVGFDLPPVLLPLAISFFTFQQIGFLVDAWRGEVPRVGLLRYALFVAFFPQLIAGPIVRHAELLAQLADRRLGRFSAPGLAVGLTLFVLGLAKKVLVADRVAGWADPVFAAAANGVALSVDEAWAGALAYTFQLYFDFSGYCDMALGLGAMFGVRLPLNFDSPYKATSVVEFWRRWHMTLSRFLRDYLYIPLGGSRRGRARRYANLMITMLLGGLWHGAGWTFVVWGGLHGFYLIANHGWRALRRRLGWSATGSGWAMASSSRLLTFLCVVVAWVLFRAESLSAALALLRAMAGFGESAAAAGATLALGPHAWAALAALLACVWLLPNTQELVRDPRGDHAQLEPRRRRLAWAPTPAWALALGLLAYFAVVDMLERSEFIYFQF